MRNLIKYNKNSFKGFAYRMASSYRLVIVMCFLLMLCSVSGYNEEYFDEGERCLWNCYREYTGSLTTTISGKTCRKWEQDDLTTPDRTFFDPHVYHNFCRQLNNKPMPWCFTNDQEWEYCFHQYCKYSPKYYRFKSNLCQVDGFREFDGKCYSVLSSPVTSVQAGEDACNELINGSRLASLHSEDHFDFINSLTCLPALVSAQKTDEWRWSDGSNWGLEEGHWSWCYREQSSENCTTLLGIKCLSKISCVQSKPLYPACVYIPRATETIETMHNITWPLAKERCESQGRRLCSIKDLCYEIIFKSLILPLNGDHLIPIADEYNDWTFVGNISETICEKHNKIFGPPAWGTNRSVCREGKKRWKKYCSALGSVVCCERENGSLDTLKPVPVKVYVQSRRSSNIPYYQYSTSENRTSKDLSVDEAHWRNSGQLEGDLRMFNLMSAYMAGIAENPIYFCSQTKYIGDLKTVIHFVSRKPCKEMYKLEFYLYVNFEPPLNSTLNFTRLSIIREGKKNTSHSRVFKDSNNTTGLITSNADKYFFIYILLTSIEDQSFRLAVPTEDPCGSHLQRVRAPVGVISSPLYPDPYPRKLQPVYCRWRVNADEGNIIRINFTNLELAKGPDYDKNIFSAGTTYERFRVKHGRSKVINHHQVCKDDRVEIKDASKFRKGSYWVDYATLCGDWKPPSFLTVHNKVAIRFYGARDNHGDGFSLTYESIAPPRGLNVIHIAGRKNLTWKIARSKCLQNSQDLCFGKDICSYGRPFYGVERGKHWSAVLDEYNDWLQIGEFNGQTCHTHNALFGPPQWGIHEGVCTASENGCTQKGVLYCCDHQLDGSNGHRNEQNLPIANLVHIKVYTTVQNGRTFYRYIRNGVDVMKPSSIWSPGRRHVGDLTSMFFYSCYRRDYRKVIYFCFKQLVPAIGRLRTAYAMFTQPCDLKDWRLSFYLYASQTPQDDLKQIYIGISNLAPYHSRAHFGSFPPLFMGTESYIIYASTRDIIPKRIGENSIVLDDVIDTCSSGEPVPVIAPSILVSPGYPKLYKSSLVCYWRIKLSSADQEAGLKLKITVEELVLEDRMDFVLVYEVPFDKNFNASGYKHIKEYTSTVRHVTLVTNDSFVLYFETDYSIEKKGFKIIAEVISDKCGGEIKDHGSTVTSMNYPFSYPGGLDCVWTISVPNAGYGIELQFGKFEIEDSEFCEMDVVSIGPPKSPQQFRFCGLPLIPPRLQFNDSTIIVNFKTSERKQVKRKGFVFSVFFWPRGSLVGVQNGTCGVQKLAPWDKRAESPQDRVIGGLEARPGSWPWVVRIDFASCGGALLNSRWVLSAGHCFALNKPSDSVWIPKEALTNYSVIAGRHHTKAKLKNEQVFQIEKAIVHPRYFRDRTEVGLGNKGFPVYDIALVKLSQAAIFSDTVTPICLPTQDVVVGESCIIAGWGAKGIISAWSGHKSTLFYAHVPVLKNSLCNSWPELRGTITDSVLCAGYPGGGVDSCWGDSGGPLMCLSPTGEYQVKGVVSWGKGCGKPLQPGVYTRVWYFYDWISDIIHN